MTDEQFESLVDALNEIANSIPGNSHLDGEAGRDGSETIVDAIEYLAREAGSIASSITPRSAVSGKDATGGHVESLTEAVMGVTAGLCRIADSISSLAEAIKRK